MNKKILNALILIVISLASSGQIYDPVSWSFSYEKSGEGKYDIIFSAEIEEGSHLYSMNLPEGGPIPTQFTFEDSERYTLLGNTREIDEGEEHFDTAFEMQIVYFTSKAEFRQTVESDASSFTVKGYVTYMACDDTKCSPPQDTDFSVSISTGEPVTEIRPASVDTGNIEDRGIFSLLIISFILGLAGVLTPCVFPMIPMTVAFFSQGSENKTSSFLKAIIFAFSIILIYSSLGIIVSLTSAGANFAGTLSTHWIPNILFFSLFVFFAASFFGAYEIVLPNKWVSSADSRVDKGGFVAAFFLGLTTVLVSFACIGPIVGALLVEAASGNVIRPTIGMFGFGLGFALPFFLFALFPSVIGKLPKSGGWLNSVKVVLGFIMLIFSLKFLSTIDSVYGLDIITRDIYLAIWIVLFFFLGLYLMGKIKFSHDSDISHIGIFRFLLIIAVFSFTVYLIPGLFGAPLKGISGLLPAMESAKFDLKKSAAPAAAYYDLKQNDTDSELCEQPLYAEKFELPYGLRGYFDYEQGMTCAREKGLPVFLDFKGHACSNCKAMESKVWSNPEVLKRLGSNFVIIALYCDDRTRLPEDEWITSKVDGKTKNTIGKVNADLEIEMFGTNTQPLYAIIDHEGKLLNDPIGYNLNVSEYLDWLDEGFDAFNK